MIFTSMILGQAISEMSITLATLGRTAIASKYYVISEIEAAILVLPVVVDDPRLRNFAEQLFWEIVIRPHVFICYHSGVKQLKWPGG